MSIERLLHPENLHITELIELLVEIGVKVPEDCDKCQAVELAHRNIVPRPQRSYHNNRTGKALRKSQQQMDKHKKRVNFSSTKLVAEFKTLKRKAEEIPQGRGLMNSPLSTDVEKTREAPPKSTINYERKTIKLSKPNTVAVQVKSERRTLENTVTSDNSPTKKARTKITWP